ncbi:MAG TPA: FKBP-type peptidyl-prolyl cis-trans isomerase [Bacteroidales bacterium]|nr:FKBP-type peptidyl-prolyl cis-trans isomerase [Bacteroidales bacterium]
MKFKGLIIATGLIITFSACSQTGVENLKLNNGIDSLAYAIGVLNQVTADRSEVDLNPMLMAKGMLDTKEGNGIMNEAAANGYIAVYMRRLQEEKSREQFRDVYEEGVAFMNENKEKDGVLTTESGLQYKVLKMGDGLKPGLQDTVMVHYTGTLVDGSKFDSSYDNGEPAKFPVQGVIAGWSEGLQLMPVGSKFMFYVPYELGYGAQGAGGVIEPYSALIFEVELLDINPE